jgi:hypothetical protein
MLKKLAAWFFYRAPGRPSPWEIIQWWEARRIPFNVLIGVYGICSLGIFVWALDSSGHLQPGEDAVEPLAIMVAPLAINALYTLGWLVEVPATLIGPRPLPMLGPTLLKLGLGLGLTLSSLPAVCWVSICALQFVGLAS